MNRRLWIIVALGAAALLAWRLWPERGSGPAHPAETAAGTGSDSQRQDGPSAPRAAAPGQAQVPPRPVRMQARSRTPDGPKAGLSIIFEAETRNPEWASRREEEVRVRAARLVSAAEPARLGAVECRSRSCRLSVAADDPAVVARAVESMGGEGGFYRFADQMTVEAVEPGEGGPRQVNVYLRFSR